MENDWMHQRINEQLEQRKEKGSLRRLPAATDDALLAADGRSGDTTSSRTPTTSRLPVDFSSNDYLGLARDVEQHALVERTLQEERKGQDLHSTTSSSLSSSASTWLGATGSRLLSGDAAHFHDLERHLATIHGGREALLCNSGYDANMAVVSCLPCDCIIYDEYVHNSLHMGMRLWQTASTSSTSNDASLKEGQEYTTNRITASFQHNNVQDLQNKLEQYSTKSSSSLYGKSSSASSPAPRIVILIESIYSMDGDVAPIRAIFDLALEYDARVVVDEAHGLGVAGACGCLVDSNQGAVRGVDHCDDTTGSTTVRGGSDRSCVSNNSTKTTVVVDADDYNITSNKAISVLAAVNCERHPALACAVYTFGKAAGCHGAVIICPELQGRQKEYLINFAYPIVYSTALPYHALVTIRCAYTTMLNAQGHYRQEQLRERMQQFETQLARALQDNRKAIVALAGNDGADDAMMIRYEPSHTPIQALIVPGNEQCSEFCRRLYDISRQRVRLYPIKSPTVPVGQERVRIIVHAHNTADDVRALVDWIVETIASLESTTQRLARSKL